MCTGCTQPQGSITKIIILKTKNKNQYSSEEMVHIIIRGVCSDGVSENTVGKICDR